MRKNLLRKSSNTIAEEAIVYALEKEFEKRQKAFISSISVEHVWEYLQSKGFVEPDKFTALYYFEPYWTNENIKSAKLREWIDRQDSNDVPDYMKKETP